MRDSYILHLCYSKVSRIVCYKLYIKNISCKSIESISISHPMNLRYAYMITLESGGMPHSKKLAYSISKIPIHQNERKQTGPKPNAHFARLKVCKNHLKTQGKGLHAPGLA
jgi:hypothetical protein